MPRARRAQAILLFLLLTFAVTWTCFFTVVRSGGFPPGAPSRPWLQVLLYLGIVAPGLVALGLTARAEGREGVRALLGRIGEWQRSARWYAFALGYMVAIKLTAALVHRLIAGAWPQFGTEPWILMVAAIPFSTIGQAGEEIGWRGFALPRLAKRFGLGLASIVLGVIWAFWHLPLFWLVGADTFGQSFPTYLLQVTALSIAIAWLYWRTNMSLLLAMLMHAAINNTKNIVPSVPRAPADPFVPSASLISWIGVIVLWVVAAYFLVAMRGAKLTEVTQEGER